MKDSQNHLFKMCKPAAGVAVNRHCIIDNGLIPGCFHDGVSYYYLHQRAVVVYQGL